MLDLLYCTLAVAEDRLPAWKMFESVERLDFALVDKDGREIDVAASLPRGARLVDRTELHEVVGWICVHQRERAPFTFVDRARGRRVDIANDCIVHATK